MPALRQYNVFISHKWRYGEDYDTIVEWLQEENNLKIADYSVSSEKRYMHMTDRELKAKLELHISRSSCVIVFLAMYSEYSDWIDFEIQTAQNYNKPIIGIRPWGQERVPEDVTSCCDVIVGWNQKSVIDAIREYSL